MEQSRGNYHTTVVLNKDRTETSPTGNGTPSIYWRDPQREARLRRDFYINHKRVSEEDYNKYLDKEKINEKSLLRRSGEVEREEKARKSVSEIFSKRAQSVIDPERAEEKKLNKNGDSKYSNTKIYRSKDREGDGYEVVNVRKVSSDNEPAYFGSRPNKEADDTNHVDAWINKDQYSRHANKPEIISTYTCKEDNHSYKPDQDKTSYNKSSRESPNYEPSSNNTYVNRVEMKSSTFSKDPEKSRTNSYHDKEGEKNGFKFEQKTSKGFKAYDPEPISKNSYVENRDSRGVYDLDPAKKHSYTEDRESKSVYEPVYVNRHARSPDGVSRKSETYFSDVFISGDDWKQPPTSAPPSPPKSRPSSGPSWSGLRFADDEDGSREDLGEPLQDARTATLMSQYHAQDAPTRSRWNLSSKGVQAPEVEEGGPCSSCQDLCTGFQQHQWRKTCQSCKCPREEHGLYLEEWEDVRKRLGLQEEGRTKIAPPRVPLVSSAPQQQQQREDEARRLRRQLPPQDLAIQHCRHLDLKHHASFEDFIAARNEIALDIGFLRQSTSSTSCGGCKKTIPAGQETVVAPRLEDQVFHVSCFTCGTCGEELAQLAYCALDGKPYCGRHYAELLKPRCQGCDELIFSGEYTKALNKDWHSGHFCCWQCDESLTGQRYVLRDDHPYCIKCYESVFANGCEECSKTIGIDSKDLSYKDKHWHEACFLCAKCRVSLVDKQFGSKVDKIYCGNCYDAQFASRCDGCGEVFRAGTKKMEYKTRQWHEKCFCCVVCKTPIGTKSFIPREQEIYCAGCYEEKFATRCVKCNKIITQGGVTYKNEPWHRECFTCSHCATSLAGQRFTSRDDKPYCAECFGELFAKRCTACVKPITGIGGTRFISFEDRHWHNDCFICALCKTSLVGRGFITDAQDIICPECAKQKLM